MSTHTEDEQVITTLSTEEIIDQRENPIKTLRQSEAFQYMMLEYGAALKIVETKLHALDSEFNLRHDRNPIESISTRLKSADSIVEKMHRRGQPVSIESIQKSLTDIAGARVICSFLDDNYIAHPKENGYRSLHLIVSIPIYLSQGRKDIPVEIQFRTIAMEFWATLEHKIKYKKKIADPESVSAELKSCADLINEIDHRMQSLRRRTID